MVLHARPLSRSGKRVTIRVLPTSRRLEVQVFKLKPPMPYSRRPNTSTPRAGDVPDRFPLNVRHSLYELLRHEYGRTPVRKPEEYATPR